MSKLEFKKLKRQNIFRDSFNEFTENNIIEFKQKDTSSIAVLYGPNGTGKTSLAKTLDSNLKEVDMDFEVDFNDKIYTKENCDIFHVVNDQNNRNIIQGKPSEYLIGENIRREVELEAYIKDICNKSSNPRGKNIDRSDFFSTIRELQSLDDIECIYEDEKMKFFIENFIDDKSLLSKIINIDVISKSYSDINQIEESEVAVSILEKYSNKNECVVCDTCIVDREELIHRKNTLKENVILKLDKDTKKILKEIINDVHNKNSDPFRIKEIMYNAIKSGTINEVEELKNEIKKYINIIDYNIKKEFKYCLNDSDLEAKYNDYMAILREDPQINDDELLFIKEIVSENIGRRIELKRDTSNGNKFILSLGGESLLDFNNRDDFRLSNGEQNFISLSFELLKAKCSDAKVVILDDPISSFDSIYKNKIAFSIIKFLSNKNVLILTHNTDLIKLLEFQDKDCFNLYIYNNNDDANNGFIPVNNNEKEILLNLYKLITLFKCTSKKSDGKITDVIKNERLFLLSMIPFMRGYANIIGDSKNYKKLSKVMHGYETDEVNITEVYNNIFGDSKCINELDNYIYENGYESSNLSDVYKSLLGRKQQLFTEQYNVTSTILMNEELNDIEILDKDKYPLLNKTLIHTLTYLSLRLKVEKILIEKFNITVTKNMLLHTIIFNAFKSNPNDSTQIEQFKNLNRVFLASRKTLLNEFNHFEGNMNIFQPAIDITDEALRNECDKLNSFLQSYDQERKIFNYNI